MEGEVPNISADTSNTIGLLGGSFDPLHNGHLAIAQSFLESQYIDSLWILLTPDPPHKQDHLQSSYSSRYQMLKKTFSEWDDVTVSNLEKTLPSPSYTVQTLKYLKKEYSDKTFYLCLGEDSARDFKDWHRWEEILSNCKLLIAKREPKQKSSLEEPVNSRAQFVTHQPVELSSTDIRQLVSESKDISDLVPPAVAQIVRDENLYKAD